MQSSLAVTTSGLPLGLAAARFWTRNKFKGTEALKRVINPTRVPIGQKESLRWIDNVRESTALLGEGARCVHIGDRESDIYELFCAAQQAGAHFLVRTCVNRLCGNGESTVARQMETVTVKGQHRMEVRDDKGQTSEATLEIKYRPIKVRPPVGKQGKYPPLKLTVIHASEREKPAGRDRIEWKLVTDLPVGSRAQAIEKLQWYALRWKIEVFHKILKSGCKVEASGVRTAGRLINLIATCCILAWRIFRMTMIRRSEPAASPRIAHTQLEMTILNRLCPDKASKEPVLGTLSDYIKIARLGGYMARARDPAAGNTVMWRGLAHLTDLTLGVALSPELVGN